MSKLMVIAVVLLALVFYYVFFGGDSFDPGTLKNKRVLVTGASSGIGEHMAYYYSQHGARLVITARRENLLKKVAEKCQKLGAGQVEVVAGDMAQPEDRSKIIEATKKRLGGLDHLILNHAILYEQWWHGTPEDLNHLQKIFQVNCFSYVDLASKSLEMLTKSQGNIGIVSSGHGEIGAMKASNYAMAKFGLHGFFSSLRQELRANNTGVSVTIMVLGLVSTQSLLENTAMAGAVIPLELFASEEDVAKDIVESVTKRYYKVRHGPLKYLLFLNDLFPKTGEDGLTDLLEAKKGTLGHEIGIAMFKTAMYLTKLF